MQPGLEDKASEPNIIIICKVYFDGTEKDFDMAFYCALTEGDFSLKASVALACRLAKKLDTELIGVSALPDPARAVMMTGVSMHGMMVASGGRLAEGIKEAQDDAREHLEKIFNEVCDAVGLAADQRSIEHHVGLPTEIYPRVSLLSDGLITPHECVTSGNEHGLAFESMLLDRRQPVIVSSTDETPDLSTMIIAWDGSPQAARAIRLNLSVLRAADRIVVAQNAQKIDVEDRFGAEDPKRVVDFLKPLKKDVDVRKFDGKVASGLLKLSEDLNAGVIVAGAYGHSRLEEMIFGGVSKSLLRADHGPALALAH